MTDWRIKLPLNSETLKIKKIQLARFSSIGVARESAKKYCISKSNMEFTFVDLSG